jgi:hypothetical protein
MTDQLATLRASRTFTIARLAAVLSSEGTVCEVEPESGNLLIRADGGETWDPPVRLALSDRQLQEYVRRASDAGPDLWPDVSPAVGGWRLFLVHLEEELACDAMAGSVISCSRHGLESSPARSVRWPLLSDPRNDLEWSAHPPGDGPGLMFLSPEQYRELLREAGRPLPEDDES